MKAIIIDNDAAVREELQELISHHCPKIAVTLLASGVESGLRLIREEQPDLVFLDVEMDDGSGLDLINRLNGDVQFQLVFITAHNKYAIDAFKLSAIDFLLKPIDLDELKESVNRADKNIRSNSLEQQLQILQAGISEIKKPDAKIAFKDSESIYFVKVSDIIRCEASGAYTLIRVNNHKDIMMSKGIKEYEEMLQDFGFLRTHHSHLVNINKITRYDKGEGGTLILENNEKVPVSQRKKDALLALLNKRS